MKIDGPLYKGIFKRIICLTLILILLLGVGVIAGVSQLNSVTIIFSDNTQLTVLTSKSNVAEILEENNIIVLDNEVVEPNLDSTITYEKTIKIKRKNNNTTDEEDGVQITSTDIINSYSSIVEKIVTERVEIPFETITKEVDKTEDGESVKKVIQEGKNGIKEITYKIKYQDDVEIEKTKVSEKVIEEPVDKIIQVSAKVSSRSGGRIAETNPATQSTSSLAAKVEGKTPIVKTMNTSAYCSCSACCGKSNGITSSGAKASTWCTVAAGKGYKIGTVLYIPYFKDKPNGGWFVVQDRGGAISNNRIDIYMGSHSQALSFGRRNLEVYVYE